MVPLGATQDGTVRGQSPIFGTTHWSVVLSAGQTDSREAAHALETLCHTYWYPLYAYVRRQGRDAHEAQDLTQGFFCRLLEKRFLVQVDPRKGRFRSFLLVAMNHFLANEWDRARALKRGSRVALVSLDTLDAEERYQHEGLATASPEQYYDQRWAMTLLTRVLARLRREFQEKDKTSRFDALKVCLTGEMAASYAVLAAQLGSTEGALKMTVQRMRRRYGEILREEIGRTVATPEEIDDEIRHLFMELGK